MFVGLAPAARRSRRLLARLVEAVWLAADPIPLCAIACMPRKIWLRRSCKRNPIASSEDIPLSLSAIQIATACDRILVRSRCHRVVLLHHSAVNWAHAVHAWCQTLLRMPICLVHQRDRRFQEVNLAVLCEPSGSGGAIALRTDG